MLVAEYDYDMDIEVQREEAYQDGVDEGERKFLKNQIEKKLSKGYTAEEISDILEEPLEKIEEIMKEL